jgi:polar amino acid transport system substrate-binding protein
MPVGSYMATIQANHFLKVGVDENTIGFAARNSQTGELKGFEIELVNEIARAIFGDPTRIKYISVVTADKVKVVKRGEVDLTASVVSITCDRARDVAFSEEYFETPQRVMVSAQSKIQHLADLAGDKVCVTSGSTTAKKVEGIHAVPYPVETRTDCLVALQQGDVDAIATHDTILRGLHLQDPRNTRILTDPADQLGSEFQRYGIAIGKGHADFVGFVNGVLEQLRANGTYDSLRKTWVDPLFQEPPHTPPITPEGAAQ